MNKTKLFFALFSVLGPVTVTQVKALPAPEAPVNEQSIRARIQKIEADIKELGQLPSLKDEATKLLEGIQKWNKESSKKPIEEKVPGAPGRNNVMAFKSFSDHLVNIENRFKHPKETAHQIQKTLSDVSAQIESQQNPAVKATLSALLNPIKQKADSLTSPVSEIDGLIAKIKTELPADSGQKDHPNGFKPNKHPNGIIIPDKHPITPDTHPNGAIPPAQQGVILEDLSTPDASVTKNIIDAMKETWTKAQSALTVIKDKNLVNQRFPQVTDANVADFAKAYNEQVGLITALKTLFTNDVVTQFNATKPEPAANSWVKEASDKFCSLVEKLRNDLTAVEKSKKDLAATKNLQLETVPDVLKHLTRGEEGSDINEALKAFGAKVNSKNPAETLTNIQTAIKKARTDLKEKDEAINAAYANIETLANKSDKPAAKAAFTAFESKYKNAIKTLDDLSTAIAKALPSIASNSKVKKTAATALKAVQTEVEEFKKLTTAKIFALGAGKKVRGKMVYAPSQYQSLKDNLNK